MKIALDFDGVLCHTMRAWIDEFNVLHPSKKTTIRDIQEWSFFEKEPFNISYDEAFKIFDYCWKHWDDLDALEVDQDWKVEKLGTLGKLDIVTSVVKNKEGIRKWLTEHKILFNDIQFTQEKWKLKYDYYIDDSPSNAKHIKEEDKICILYDQPWNREVKTNGNIKRVYNLNHAYDVIKKMEENEIKS